MPLIDLPHLRSALLRWFSRNKRPLPWRTTRDPYAIWVSEVMLQQTTVATVIPFYGRFMKRFPTLAALASSDVDDVLSLWSGLGYYSRARNLRLAAQDVIANHHGRVPRDVETAMTLRGVGRYTASAVTSLAYGARAAVVDGNVRRVLSRLHTVRGLTDARAQGLADALLSPRSPGDWNEAMMELGATVCTPRAPACPVCPVFAFCLGRTRAEYWSEGKPRRASVATKVEMALVRRNDRILLVRNPKGSLMEGLYELPNSGLPGKPGPSTGLHQKYLGALVIDAPGAITVRHTVTHHRIAATVFRATARRSIIGGAFHRLEAVTQLPLGGLTRKALRALGLLAV